MAPLQMAKWKAFRQIQPDIGDRLCEIAKLGFCAMVNVQGGKCEPDDFEPAPDKKRPTEITPRQAAANAAAILPGVVRHGNSDR